MPYALFGFAVSKVLFGNNDYPFYREPFFNSRVPDFIICSYCEQELEPEEVDEHTALHELFKDSYWRSCIICDVIVPGRTLDHYLEHGDSCKCYCGRYFLNRTRTRKHKKVWHSKFKKQEKTSSSHRCIRQFRGFRQAGKIVQP